MAVQKSRKSKSKRDMRRAHYRNKISASNLSKCSRCGEPKLSHRVCIQCGYYGDKEVVLMDQAG